MSIEHFGFTGTASSGRNKWVFSVLLLRLGIADLHGKLISNHVTSKERGL